MDSKIHGTGLGQTRMVGGDRYHPDTGSVGINPAVPPPLMTQATSGILQTIVDMRGEVRSIARAVERISGHPLGSEFENPPAGSAEGKPTIPGHVENLQTIQNEVLHLRQYIADVRTLLEKLI